MEIDRSKFKVLDKKSGANIHYLLNPGLAFNELVLGQRIPKVMLIDQTSDLPLMERYYVPCPHCDTLHDGRTWSSINKTAFKNWFGLFCPNCQSIIPCFSNWTASCFRAVTFPFWFWWIRHWKQSWLNDQPLRYENISFEKITHKQINWVKIGLAWGGMMFGAMALILPFIVGVKNGLLISLIVLPICMIAGLLFGLTVKATMGKK